MRTIKLNQIYKHYKGTKVLVLGVCKHSETLEDMVYYIHLEDGCSWVRPLKIFLEKVTHNGSKVVRFKILKKEILD